MGYLSRIRQWAVPVVEGVGTDNMGDYAVGETVNQSIRAHTNEHACDWLVSFSREHMGDDIHMVVYAMNIKHAQVITELINDRGLRADYIAAQSEMSEERRDRVVAEFKSGELDVIVNIQVLTEGFDCEGANSIAILRPTKSLALYLQMIGRGTRVARDKECLYVLDATSTSHEFGTAVACDSTQIWSLESRGEVKEGSAPSKSCPNCGAVNHASAVACIECGYQMMVTM